MSAIQCKTILFNATTSKEIEMLRTNTLQILKEVFLNFAAAATSVFVAIS